MRSNRTCLWASQPMEMPASQSPWRSTAQSTQVSVGKHHWSHHNLLHKQLHSFAQHSLARSFLNVSTGWTALEKFFEKILYKDKKGSKIQCGTRQESVSNLAECVCTGTTLLSPPGFSSDVSSICYAFNCSWLIAFTFCLEHLFFFNANHFGRDLNDFA